MDRRTDAVELLDGPLDDLSTLAGNLRDLGRINRHLGGVDLSATAIDALAAHVDALTMLDVGTGGADIPMALLERARARDRRLAIVGLDSRPEVLEAAVLATPALATTDGLELHVGDGTSLPYPDRSFDVAHCSLVLHHLSPDEAVVAARGDGAGGAARGRGQRPGPDPARAHRGVADGAPADRQPVHAGGRAVVGSPVVSGGRGGRVAAGGRPDAGANAARRVRPAVGDRRGPDADGGRRRGPRPPGRGRMTHGASGAALEDAAVVIVGGGPAGAVLAARLASAGVAVLVLERAPAWHWHAGGVFTSPAAVTALRRAGLDAATLAAVARPIPAMRVETASGTSFRLTYGTEDGGEPAVGFDRSRLDPLLLERAATAGAEVRRGWNVTAVDLARGSLETRGPDGRSVVIRAPVIVGADGAHSVVAGRPVSRARSGSIRGSG